MKEYATIDKMRVARCIVCLSPVYQRREGAVHRSLFPRMFDCFDRDNKTPIYPEELKPLFHNNYENRTMDWNDDLPKFACFPPENMLNNNGTPKL